MTTLARRGDSPSLIAYLSGPMSEAATPQVIIPAVERFASSIRVDPRRLLSAAHFSAVAGYYETRWSNPVIIAPYSVVSRDEQRQARSSDSSAAELAAKLIESNVAIGLFQVKPKFGLPDLDFDSHLALIKSLILDGPSTGAVISDLYHRGWISRRRVGQRPIPSEDYEFWTRYAGTGGVSAMKRVASTRMLQEVKAWL